jgi:hypothetical protein
MMITTIKDIIHRVITVTRQKFMKTIKNGLSKEFLKYHRSKVLSNFLITRKVRRDLCGQNHFTEILLAQYLTLD